MKNKLEKLGKGHYKYKGYEICDAFVSRNHDGSDAMLYHEYDGIKDHKDIEDLVNYFGGRWYIRFDPDNNDDEDYLLRNRSLFYDIEIHPNTYRHSRLERDDKGKICYSSITFYSTIDEVKKEIDLLYNYNKDVFLQFHAKKLKMFFDISQTNGEINEWWIRIYTYSGYINSHLFTIYRSVRWQKDK